MAIHIDHNPLNSFPNREGWGCRNPFDQRRVEPGEFKPVIPVPLTPDPVLSEAEAVFESVMGENLGDAIQREVRRAVKALHDSIETALKDFLNKKGLPSDGSVHYTVHKTESPRGDWIYSVRLGEGVVPFAQMTAEDLWSIGLQR